MPTLHRLATLRDDVIYFIALYQAWIYRVDYRRVNEFGQGGGDEIVEVDDKTKEKLDEEVLKAEGETEPVAVAAASGGATGAEKAKGGKKRR